MTSWAADKIFVLLVVVVLVVLVVIANRRKRRRELRRKAVLTPRRAASPLERGKGQTPSDNEVRPEPVQPTPSEKAVSLLSAYRLEEFARLGSDGIDLVLPAVEQLIAAGQVGQARDMLTKIRGALKFEPLSMATMPGIAVRVRGYRKQCPVEAANLLAALRDNESICSLEAMLSADDWSLRMAIAKALRELDYGKTVSEIMLLLRAEEIEQVSLPDGLHKRIAELREGVDETLEADLIALKDYNRGLARAKFWGLSRIGYVRTIDYLRSYTRKLFADLAADALARVVCHRLSSLSESMLQSLQHCEDLVRLEPYEEGPFGEERVSTILVRRLADLELRRRLGSAA